MKIYHNPRCSKSRQTLELISELKKNVEIVEYLKTPPTKSELHEIVSLLGMAPVDLIRKTETEYKENYKGKDLSNDEWIDAMVKFPKLMERPIVISNGKAIIGRPPENVSKLM